MRPPAELLTSPQPTKPRDGCPDAPDPRLLRLDLELRLIVLIT